MNQQRTRRHKGMITPKINNVIGMNENQMKWTTSHITPGTSFMNKLSNRVSKAFGGLENHYGVKKIIISCSDKAGESYYFLLTGLMKKSVKLHGQRFWVFKTRRIRYKMTSMR